MRALWRAIPVGVLLALLVEGCNDDYEESLCPRGASCTPDGGTGPQQPGGGPSPLPTPGDNFTVTARPATNGAVRITSEPARIDCLNNDNTQGDRCVEDFPANSTVRLTATAQTGHTFVRWEGGPCDQGTGAVCTLPSLSAPVTTTAISAPVVPPPPPPGNRITWTGAAGSNVWGTAGNWDLGRVPAPGDEVFIGNPSSVTILAATTPIEVERILLDGALFVEGGVQLRVLKDMTGTGSLGVLSSATGGRGSVNLGQASSLRSISSSGSISFTRPTGQPSGFDAQPTFRVEQASFTTAAGVMAPGLTNLQLEASRSVAIEGSLDLNGTLRVPGGASLTWSGSGVGSQSLGSGGQFIGGCRLQNSATMTVQVGLIVNCALENDGVITLHGNATFMARGVNRGTIRSLALFGSPGLLIFRGRSGDAPHWRFEPTSIVEEGFGRISIAAGSVVQGRLRATSLQLSDVTTGTGSSTHEVHLAQVTIDTLESNANLVDLRFAGIVNLLRLTVGGTLQLPAGTNVLRATQSILGGGAVLQGGILESQNVLIAGGGVPIILAGRLWVTSEADMSHGTVIGRAGMLELRGGTLDLNPGSGNAIDIRTEGTSGSDLVVVNSGLIRKRGAGTASIRACFQGGVGNVVNEGAATPVTIVELAC